MKKSILSPATQMILKSSYPLPCAEFKSSGDDEIERGCNSLEVLADGQEEERSPSLLPCAEPESSGDG